MSDGARCSARFVCGVLLFHKWGLLAYCNIFLGGGSTHDALALAAGAGGTPGGRSRTKITDSLVRLAATHRRSAPLD